MGGERAYRDVLAVRDARFLIGASGASQLGDWLYNAALLGYVYSATDSAGWVAAATIFRLLPFVLLGPVGGAIADRFPRRTVLLAGDLLRLVLMLVLAGVVASDGPVAVVIALTALASVAGTAEKPAGLALLPRLVGEARMGPANALLHTVQDLGVVVGPAIGAVLLAVTSPSVAFLVNGATFALSALLISRLRPRPARAGAAGGALAHVIQGLRATREAPFALPLFLVAATGEFIYGAQTVQLVVYAERVLDLGDSGYGWLLAASGAGGLLSATVNGRLSTSTRVSIVVVSAAALLCVTELAYAGIEVVAIALAITVIGGGALVASEVVAETGLARVVPPEALGRVFGVFDSASVGAMIAGALIAPLLISWTSLDGSLLIIGGASLAVALGCLFWLRGLDSVCAERGHQLASRVAILEALPITGGSPRRVLEQLASAAQMCPLPPGVDVVVQGADAHALYAVVDGRVVVHRDGKAVVHLGPGDSFGERGLLDSAPRNATVTTEMDTTVMRMEGDVVLDALTADPALRPVLDRSSSAPGVEVPAGERPLVDDPRWIA